MQLYAAWNPIRIGPHFFWQIGSDDPLHLSMQSTHDAHTMSLAQMRSPSQQCVSTHDWHEADHFAPASVMPHAALASAESGAVASTTLASFWLTVDESTTPIGGSGTRLQAHTSPHETIATSRWLTLMAFARTQLLANFSAGYFFAAASRCSDTKAEVTTSGSKSREPSG